ncbi:C6 transcription factor [Pleurostoma richardsiae]|uniref:C6 transcription factor n=1 Tax=Pleurostoma richardsiae TaxID=41990 RepID=A0AA38SFU6_9PEZI|nr:C6 transcription factor [Pleurostoma richardsiae]
MAGPSLSHLLQNVDDSTPTPALSAPPPLTTPAITSITNPPLVAPLSSATSPAGSITANLGPPHTPVSASPTTPGGARGHASNTSLYQCADCLRRYSRPEHLQRHIATHTLGKRFLCDVCGKAFGRADLLKRHRANHDNDDNGTKKRRINASPSAGRVAHACVACAKARVKCEEVKPCARCRSRNINCEYSSSEAGSAAAMHLLHLSATAHSASLPTHPAATTSSQTAHTPSPRPYRPQSDPPSHRLRPVTAPESNPLQVQTTDNNPPLGVSHPLSEEAQLPTPETIMDQSNPDSYAPSYQANNPVDMSRLPFSDFLRDVLYDQQLQAPKVEEAQGLAVLDFCDDSNLDLNDMDFGLLDQWNVGGVLQDPSTQLPPQQYAPHSEDPADISQMRRTLVKIWTDSPWRWMPSKTDNAYSEQASLPVPSGDAHSVQFQETRRRLDRVVNGKVDQAGRDKILAIVLGTLKTNTIINRVASSFPSAELIDTLVHFFLASHLCQVSTWIHYGSFKLNTQRPELLAVAAAAGAVLTPVQTLRKFGFALAEAVRLDIPERFEEHHASIQNLGLVQALILGQDIALWSGNRKKMEIAECHLQIPTTMMRYRGIFQRTSYPPIAVDPADEGDVLNEKWKKWCQRESWKRLAFHLFLRHAQTSMTTLVNTSISYAELSLPLPEAKELWFARSPQEWKVQYLQRSAGQAKRPPSLVDLFRDINLLFANHERLDVQFAISIYLHGFWALIWEWRQLNAVHRLGPFSPPGMGGSTNMLISARHQELCKQLHNFQLAMSGWNEVLSTQESLVLNLLQMNLHVSLDDLQLFSGKEGEEQARRIYPTLQRWTDSAESRQALWHAGQILRCAKGYPSGHLKDFYAIAVHHAALALWTHGVVAKATRRVPSAAGYETMVFLDEPESTQVENFIRLGQGRAAVRGPAAKGGETGGGAAAYLEDPRACMEVAQDILRANFQMDGQLPPIVENLCHLIKQLGNAAWAVGLG